MIITETMAHGSHRIVMCGRLDVHSVPDLRLSIHRVIDGGAGDVLLDLTEAEIGDATALGLLVECLRRARRAGASLRIEAADARTIRLLLRRARLGSTLVPAAAPTGPDASLPALAAG